MGEFDLKKQIPFYCGALDGWLRELEELQRISVRLGQLADKLQGRHEQMAGLLMKLDPALRERWSKD